MSHSVADRIKQRLGQFSEDLERGARIQQEYTCRKVESLPAPGSYNAAAVKRTRELLRVSQSLIAMFLGVSVKTVQAWERGVTAPNKMACRFMDSIQSDPAYWLKVLRKQMAAK